MPAPVKHHAPFSAPVLAEIGAVLEKECADAGIPQHSFRVLDPFSGIGRIHTLPFRTFGVEIEEEWASQVPENGVEPMRTVCADFLQIALKPAFFDAVATRGTGSPITMRRRTPLSGVATSSTSVGCRRREAQR